MQWQLFQGCPLLYIDTIWDPDLRVHTQGEAGTPQHPEAGA